MYSEFFFVWLLRWGGIFLHCGLRHGSNNTIWRNLWKNWGRHFSPLMRPGDAASHGPAFALCPFFLLVYTLVLEMQGLIDLFLPSFNDTNGAKHSQMVPNIPWWKQCKECCSFRKTKLVSWVLLWANLFRLCFAFVLKAHHWRTSLVHMEVAVDFFQGGVQLRAAKYAGSTLTRVEGRGTRTSTPDYSQVDWLSSPSNISKFLDIFWYPSSQLETLQFETLLLMFMPKVYLKCSFGRKECHSQMVLSTKEQFQTLLTLGGSISWSNRSSWVLHLLVNFE